VTRPRRSLAALLCAAAILTACGGDDDTASSATSTSTTATTAPETRQPATDAGDAPERIVSLGPSGTEILYAVGAGDQVVAVDEQSDFPDGVPTTDLSSYEPNVEAVAAYEPDLVVVTGSVPQDALDGMDAAGIDVLFLDAPTNLDEMYEQFSDIGIATGHEDEAADLVRQVRAGIDAATADVADRAEAPTYYHELDPTLFTVTSSTFIGQLYALAGLENIADAADADGSLGGYPQLSAELVVQADPDFVFLADSECCNEDTDTFAARPGFADLTAVQEGHVVELDDDVASRWGPRVVDFLRTVVDATS
jgi:iron complex transport system substrate-binding protein